MTIRTLASVAPDRSEVRASKFVQNFTHLLLHQRKRVKVTLEQSAPSFRDRTPSR